MSSEYEGSGLWLSATAAGKLAKVIEKGDYRGGAQLRLSRTAEEVVVQVVRGPYGGATADRVEEHLIEDAPPAEKEATTE